MKPATLFLLVLSLLATTAYAGDAPADLALIHQGELPIIITAPHGGRLAIPGIAERDITGKPGGGAGFVKGGDTNTDVLALAMAAEIKALTGREPYVVLARFQRRYIDPNRPPEIALDDPKARPYYDAYHGAIRRFVDEVREKYPAAILIDVHGQAKDPDVVMRGTRNGETVTRLVRRAGLDSITGPHGLFGELEANGFKVFPGNNVPARGNFENAGLNGGHTVNIYGSDRNDGIDAVQMEFGSRYRQNNAAEQSGKDAGRAVATFYQAYLKDAERK